MSGDLSGIIPILLWGILALGTLCALFPLALRMVPALRNPHACAYQWAIAASGVTSLLVWAAFRLEPSGMHVYITLLVAVILSGICCVLLWLLAPTRVKAPRSSSP